MDYDSIFRPSVTHLMSSVGPICARRLKRTRRRCDSSHREDCLTCQTQVHEQGRHANGEDFQMRTSVTRSSGEQMGETGLNGDPSDSTSLHVSPGFELIDTFPSFLEYWEAARKEPVEDRIKRWETEYISRWPELRDKQIDSRRRDRVDWRSVACRRIFPHLEAQLPAMRRIHNHLAAWIGPLFLKAAAMYDLPFQPVFVIYVGIGVGAGWATRFEGRRAVLFGLENAAELGWTDRHSVEATIAHELGHLAHQEWRARAGLPERPKREGPYWSLYEEGFAVCFERAVAGHFHWSAESGWVDWCQRNLAWLASSYLRTVRHRRPVRRFFGSWYRVRGHTETGHYLGYEVVRGWSEHLSLPEIAILSESEVRRQARHSLLELARHTDYAHEIS